MGIVTWAVGIVVTWPIGIVVALPIGNVVAWATGIFSWPMVIVTCPIGILYDQ